MMQPASAIAAIDNAYRDAIGTLFKYVLDRYIEHIRIPQNAQLARETFAEGLARINAVRQIAMDAVEQAGKFE